MWRVIPVTDTLEVLGAQSHSDATVSKTDANLGCWGVCIYKVWKLAKRPTPGSPGASWTPEEGNVFPGPAGPAERRTGPPDGSARAAAPLPQKPRPGLPVNPATPRLGADAHFGLSHLHPDALNEVLWNPDSALSTLLSVSLTEYCQWSLPANTVNKNS